MELAKTVGAARVVTFGNFHRAKLAEPSSIKAELSCVTF